MTPSWSTRLGKVWRKYKCLGNPGCLLCMRWWVERAKSLKSPHTFSRSLTRCQPPQTVPRSPGQRSATISPSWAHRRPLGDKNDQPEHPPGASTLAKMASGWLFCDHADQLGRASDSISAPAAGGGPVLKLTAQAQFTGAGSPQLSAT